jgi:hypothetical protein
MRWIVSVAAAALVVVALGGRATAEERHDKCRLANGIEHIVYLQFDNVHLRRDIPNVPSDLEQMPNLRDVACEPPYTTDIAHGGRGGGSKLNHVGIRANRLGALIPLASSPTGARGWVAKFISLICPIRQNIRALPRLAKS